MGLHIFLTYRIQAIEVIVFVLTTFKCFTNLVICGIYQSPLALWILQL